MNKLIDLFLQHLVPLWHKKEVGIGLAFVGAVCFLFAAYGDERFSVVELVAGTLLFFTLITVWVYTNKLPRTKKGKVGIAVAIHTDDRKEARQIESDLIASLRKLLQRDPEAANFHLIRIPRWRAAEVIDIEATRRIQAQTGCVCILFGRATVRNHQRKEVYVLDLGVSVHHAPIPVPISKRLSQEFRQALPSRVLLPREDEVVAFEVTTAWLDVSMRFILGLAAQAAGDLYYAEKLLAGIETALHSPVIPPPVGRSIAHLLPQRLLALYEARRSTLYDQYLISRDSDYLRQAELVCKKILARHADNYGGLLMTAMCAFVLRRDVDEAVTLIRKCRRIQDSTWRYSLAFLLAYKGDLEGAHDEYRRAFRAPTLTANVHIQTEDFIYMVLNEEPEKGQLHFCLALINYTGKQDRVSARREFDRFLESPAANRYPREKELAEELREKCASTE